MVSALGICLSSNTCIIFFFFFFELDLIVLYVNVIVLVVVCLDYHRQYLAALNNLLVSE